MIRNRMLLMIVTLSIVCPILLLASMSDSTALKLVRDKWGLFVGLESYRIGLDTNWNRAIILNSPHCNTPITTLGAGTNTWEAAFANIDFRLANDKLSFGGPFKQIINIQLAYPNFGGVVGKNLWLDGVLYEGEYHSEMTDNVNTGIVYITNVDTTVLAFGMHVFCLITQDGFGTIVQRSPIIFLVDQTHGINESFANQQLTFQHDYGVPEFTKWLH